MTGISGIEARLVEMFDRQAVFWLALLVALGVGAAHAVAPGTARPSPPRTWWAPGAGTVTRSASGSSSR